MPTKGSARVDHSVLTPVLAYRFHDSHITGEDPAAQGVARGQLICTRTQVLKYFDLFSSHTAAFLKTKRKAKVVVDANSVLTCFHSPSYHQHALPHQKQPADMLMLTEQTQTNLLAGDTESLTGLQVSAFSSGPLRPPALAESGPNGSPGAHGSVLLGLSLAWVPKRVWTRGLGCFYTHPCTENSMTGFRLK